MTVQEEYGNPSRYFLPKREPSYRDDKYDRQADQNPVGRLYHEIAVKNCPPSAPDNELKSLFEPFGHIYRFNRNQKIPVLSFFTFYDLRSCDRAVRELDGYVFLGKKLHVEYVFRPSHPDDPHETCSRMLLYRCDRGLMNPSFESVKSALLNFGEINTINETDAGEYLVDFFEFRACRQMFETGTINIGKALYKAHYCPYGDHNKRPNHHHAPMQQVLSCPLPVPSPKVSISSTQPTQPMLSQSKPLNVTSTQQYLPPTLGQFALAGFMSNMNQNLAQLMMMRIPQNSQSNTSENVLQQDLGVYRIH